MAFHLDADVLAFAATTFTVIFGSKASLQKNTRPIPTRYDLEEVPESQLTDAQRRYLQPIDEQLQQMNYRADCTFRARNYGSNLMRRYSNPADPASCGLTVVEVKIQKGRIEGVRNANSVEFMTRLADGRAVSTRNSPNKSLMDQPPYKIVQEFPNLTDLQALKKRHDALAAQFHSGTSTPPYGTAAIFEEVQREHARFSEYQVERGVLRRTPDGEAYEITEKVMNRGIRNYFNPFSARFSAAQALFSLLLGAVLPLFAILKLAPGAAAPYGQGLAFAGPTLLIALCYALTGAILGLTCKAPSFVWVMLITYVPAHLVAGSSLGWFPYSTLAFYVAYTVSQAKQRRELVLQS